MPVISALRREDMRGQATDTVRRTTAVETDRDIFLSIAELRRRYETRTTYADVTRDSVSIELAVSDHLMDGEDRNMPVARLFRGAEYAGDSSNWFAPNVAALTNWRDSCGLEPTHVRDWPDPPARAIDFASATEPEWASPSYKPPLSCSVRPRGRPDDQGARRVPCGPPRPARNSPVSASETGVPISKKRSVATNPNSSRRRASS